MAPECVQLIEMYNRKYTATPLGMVMMVAVAVCVQDGSGK